METEEIGSPPSMASLYVRALLPKGGSRKDVPQRRLVLRDVPADPGKVRRYAKVCGFPDREVLPVTFPHVVAFPLHMELMARKDFPFPLLGLVHLTNRIEQLRAIGTKERLTYQVWNHQPVPHPKGTTFQIEAVADEAGTPVWRSVSTYLVRGRGSGESAPEEALDLGAAGLDERWKVPGSIGRDYGAVSGDRNPIHMHPLTARLFGFPKAIAHGMWTKARSLAALESVLPEAYAVEIGFRAPVLLPTQVRFRAAGTAAHWDFELTSASSGREHLRGKVSPVE
ncbi:MaoC/PaaZ C-terminal domain-containing protein [Streptomyces sp. B1866]|uniref:MaoC family dehydratase n=1 Tax=Streptomyces sp. B1866 TaxID=3075431 RepID=UPI002891DD13|nr:MaoC/PaaZ C-terminal domain-containing protein [Streptomyces sp. B1866]MDT3398238.1 MaoC/PaaZ C-terminal domain-containing protein [Streptomyces sp. B1866]